MEYFLNNKDYQEVQHYTPDVIITFLGGNDGHDLEKLKENSPIIKKLAIDQR